MRDLWKIVFQHHVSKGYQLSYLLFEQKFCQLLFNYVRSYCIAQGTPLSVRREFGREWLHVLIYV